MVPPTFATSAIRLVTGDVYQLFLQFWHNASIPIKVMAVCIIFLLWRVCVDFTKKLNKKLEKKDLEIVNTKIDDVQEDVKFVKKALIDVLKNGKS